ncbi:MAG TPA: ABC transporter permease, partial [Candidatus Cryosericum sp.]|nr:ABC transporter permease [Candidatus Cryosericum sp.]
GSLVLALAAIIVGAAVSATMLNLRADLGSKLSRELRRYGPNLILTPDAAHPGASAQPVEAAGAIAATLDEAAVRAVRDPEPSPLLIAAGEVTARERTSAAASPGVASTRAAAAIVGADFAALRRLNPSWQVEGAWPEGAGACLVGAALARRAGMVPGGETAIGVAGTSERMLLVAGVVSTGEAEDDQIFVPLALAQEMTGLAGRLSLATYAVDGGTEAVARAAARLEAGVPGSSARPLRPIAAAQGAILGKLNRMMLLLTAVVLTLSALCLTTTLMGMVVEREPEIGLMRSLGAGDGDVLRIFLGEVTLLGLAGGAAGVLLGAAGARVIGARLFGAAIEARPAMAPLVFLIALLVCWAAVLLPLRRALAIQPAAALRSE